MTGSQQDATAAALTELHIAYQTQAVVVTAKPGFPAYGVLKAGDVITAVDGHPVTGQASLTSLIAAHPAGSTLTLTIIQERPDPDGPGRDQGIRRPPGDGRAGPAGQFKFPFTVKFSVGDIGGPSAGMMFALGIIDKLTTDGPDRRQVHRRHRRDRGQRAGGRHRRHPAEDGGRPRGGRDGLPGSRVQLLGRQGRDPGRPAGGQGRPRSARPSRTCRTSRRASPSPPADAARGGGRARACSTPGRGQGRRDGVSARPCFAQGVGFIADGTSSRHAQGRAVGTSSDACCPMAGDDPGREQVRSWHLAYLLMRPTCQPTGARSAGTLTG